MLRLMLFLLLSTMTIHSQDLKWVKNMSGTGGAEGKSICIDALGNVYTIGQFTGTVDFDPGTNILNLTSVSSIDYYISKMDSLGNLLWVKQFGGGDGDMYAGSTLGISIDNFGNILAVGSFTGSVDFDPGPGVSMKSTSGVPLYKEDYFILKLDHFGNFIWVNTVPSADNTVGMGNGLYSMAIDQSDNIYITGVFSNNVDFDSGPGINILHGNPRSSFICKFSSSGNYLWAKKIGNYVSGNYCMASSCKVITDPTNHIYLIGNCNGPTGYDDGFTVFPICNGGSFIIKLDNNGNYTWSKSIANYSAFYGLMDQSSNFYLLGYGNFCTEISKLDPTGNFIWTKNIPSNINIRGFALSQIGNLYFTGYFNGTSDFDSGLGISNLSSQTPNKYDACVFKLNNNGDFNWARQFGGQGNDAAIDLMVDSAENLYTTGVYHGTADFDPSNNVYNITAGSGPYNAFVLKLKKNICSDFTLLIDSVSRIGCNSSGYASGQAINGVLPYSYSWNTTPITTNSTAIITNPGIYGLTISDANTCTVSSSVIINSPNTFSNSDLNVNLISNNFRPGYTSNIWLDGFNDGCLPVTGKLKIKLDPKLYYNSAYPIPNLSSGDTLIWNFNSLTYDSIHVKPYISVTTLTTAVIGDTINLTTIMTPNFGDIDTTNNVKKYKINVVNAFDPNIKSVFPKGKCDEGYILNNQTLTYTIRFQNTGNAEAINISVLDQLDSNLNPNTVRVVGYSHSVFTELLEDNIIKFNFKNIFLPDSSSNEPKSHGYIVFEVTPYIGLSNKTKIKNSVGIYFDFNEAVLTNTVTNTITDMVPEYCYNSYTENYFSDNKIYPNPTNGIFTIELNDQDSDIEIVNILGQPVYKTSSNGKGKMYFDLNYTSGIYYMKITDTEGTQSILKIIKY